MDPVERWLSAVRTWLPRDLQDNVVAELRADLRAELADRAAEAGRPLTPAEVEAVVARRGHPIRVAGGFLPQQHLVGPALFPAYRATLMVVVLGVLVPLYAAVVGPLAVAGAPEPGRALVSALRGLAEASVTAVGLVTLLFAVLERSQVRLGFLDRWSARWPSLGALRPGPTSRVDAAIRLVITVLVTAFFVDLLWSARSAWQWGEVEVAFAPGWAGLRWVLLPVALVDVVAAALALAFPAARRLQVVLEVAAYAATAAFAALLARAAPLWAVTVAGDPERAARIEAALDAGARWVLLGVGVGCLALAALEIVRWLRAERAARAEA